MGSEDLWGLAFVEGRRRKGTDVCTRESSRCTVIAGGSINWCSQCGRKLDVLTKRNGITI